jgi:hypothetical protein
MGHSLFWRHPSRRRVSVLVLIDFSCEQIKTIISHAEPSAICGTEKTMPRIAETLENGASPDIPASIPVVYLDSIANTRKDTYTQKSDPDTSLLVSVGGSAKRLFCTITTAFQIRKKMAWRGLCTHRGRSQTARGSCFPTAVCCGPRKLPVKE